MQERATLNGDAAEKNGDHQHKTHYARLFRRFVLLTVVCSLKKMGIINIKPIMPGYFAGLFC